MPIEPSSGSPGREVRAATGADMIQGAARTAANGETLKDGLAARSLSARATQEAKPLISKAAQAALEASGTSRAAPHLTRNVLDLLGKARIVPVVSAVAGTVFTVEDTAKAVREHNISKVPPTAKTLNWVKVGTGVASVALGVGAVVAGASLAPILGTSAAVFGLASFAAGLARNREGP